MNIFDLERMLEDNNIQEILKSYEEIFSKLDEYSDYLTSGEITPADIERLLMRATGYWGVLDLAFNIVDSYKSKLEGEFYCSKKIELEKANEKFNSSATEKEASASVNPQRRLRNILDSYKNRSEKIITSSQSYLKHISESYKRNKNQEG